MDVHLEEHEKGILVSAEVRSVWKPGVEVEAITAVTGALLNAYDSSQPVLVDCYEILPDDREVISTRLKKLADAEGFQLVFTTGGTGLGPRDVTPGGNSARRCQGIASPAPSGRARIC